MAKIFETQFHKGSYIDRISKVAGTNTDGVFRRLEKGIAWKGISTSKIELNQTLVLGTVFSFEAWIRVTDNTLSFQALAGFYSGDSYPLLISPVAQTLYTHDGTNNASEVRAELFDHKWHHVLVTRNGTSVFFYVDNIVGSEKTLASNNSISVTKLFLRSVSGFPFEEYCSNIVINDHILTAKERAQAYQEFVNVKLPIENKHPKYGPWNKPTSLKEEGLVAAYNMIHSIGGIGVDISGNGKNFTISGALSSLKGLRFDGIDNFGAHPGYDLSGGIITYMMRVKMPATAAEIDYFFSNKKTLIRVNPSWFVQWFPDTDISSVVSTIKVFANQWHTIIITQNGTAGAFYIDGVEETFSGLEPLDNTNASNYFARWGASIFAKVEFEDFRVSNRRITAQQAKDYHNSFASRIVLQDKMLFDKVGAAVPHGWRKGTGTYEIKEISGLIRGSLLDAGKGKFDSGIEGWVPWTTNTISNDEGSLKIVYEEGGSSGGAYSYFRATGDLNTDLTIGQHYKVIARAKRNDVGSCGLRIHDGVGFLDVVNLTTEYEWYEMIFQAKSATAARLQQGNMGDGEIVWIDEWYIEEFWLPEFKNGTKYLECISPGTIIVPNPFAYGTPEFFIYSVGNLRIFFINSRADLDGNAYEFNTNGSGAFRLQIRPSGSQLMQETFVANSRKDTWYGILPSRTKAGVFLIKNKGGDFGDEYINLDPTGSGTNPVTDNTFKTSNYIVLDFDAGDRIHIPGWLEGVLQ